MFSAIFDPPFTHLRHVRIELLLILSLQAALLVNQMLSIPTLSSVRLQCVFTQFALFERIWDRYSPGIVQLGLSYAFIHPDSDPHVIDTVPPFRPESLQIGILGSRLSQDILSFDLSALKVLSIGRYMGDFPVESMGAALQTILALDFVVTVRISRHASQTDTNIIDLSLCPNLALLRMSVALGMLSNAPEVLSTISTSNRIRKIVIVRSRRL
ncbi:hypothetical protein FB451DRAFT_1264093 [Mycena latifolia]|nr:hypothetical protein FB451DRAFT_1264093 [Mycena latifolia]